MKLLDARLKGQGSGKDGFDSYSVCVCVCVGPPYEYIVTQREANMKGERQTEILDGR